MLAARQDIYITIAKISSELSGLDNPDNLENEFLQAEQLSIELEKDIDELLKTLENAKVNLTVYFGYSDPFSKLLYQNVLSQLYNDSVFSITSMSAI